MFDIVRSGKTLSYLLPIVQPLLNASSSAPPLQLNRSALGTLAVVVCPTRELVQQVYDTLDRLLAVHYTGGRWIVPCMLSGGEKKKAEKARIRKGYSNVFGECMRIIIRFFIEHFTSYFHYHQCYVIIITIDF